MHNGRTILKELFHEFKIQIAGGEDLRVIALEAVELCQNDEPLKKSLSAAFDPMIAALNGITKEKAITEPKEKKAPVWHLPSVKRLRFVLEDTLPHLDDRYLTEAVDLLDDAIRNDVAPFSRVQSIVSCLLTDLVSRGWTLESLHEWAGNLGGQKGGSRTFDERFDFMRQQVMRDPQPFDVTLRLSGNPTISQLGTFKGWSFSATAPVAPNPQREFVNYLRPDAQTSFAKCTVSAVDFKSASHAAMELFENCVDRLRFNFLDTKLQLDARMLVVRCGDQKTRLEKLVFPVPNPVFTTLLDQFRADSVKIDDLLRNGTLAQTSRERIEASARHYRLGQDADSYRDKLLNWWFGLEYLTKVSRSGSIGGAVTQHGKNCMMARYLLLLLLDLEPSLRKCVGNWPASVKAHVSCHNSTQLKPEKLILLMQDPTCKADVEAALTLHPWLLVRFKELADICSDPGKLAKYVEEHGKRVEWQLKRLYRVRCCLVHGSPMILRLMLLCANLEFYLRETMVIVLRTMLAHPQVTSLDDFYDRLRFSLEHRAANLKATTAGDMPGPRGILDGLITSTKP
jgi:hypothetical protein